MNNKKNLFLIIGVVALVVIAAVSMMKKETVAPTTNTTTTVAAVVEGTVPSKMTLFFSNTCPHCRVVEEYITKNNTKTKIDFDEKEVSNQDNVKQLLAAVQKCELSQENVGVPFL
jgi:glutaredoxin-related protein